MTEANKQRYASTLKHPDTEEPIDLLFYRPVGYRVALLGEKLGWTPNMISVASILFGVACGLLCYPSQWQWNLLGIGLLVLADICDSADGQLARMTHQYSRFGRILDGASGDLWFIAIYASICCRLFPQWGVWIWMLAAAAGFCHSKQAQLSDYYRNIHLFFAKGKNGSEWDDARCTDQTYRSIRFADAPLYKVFMWFYRNYVKGQETMTPKCQKLRTLLQQRYQENPVAGNCDGNPAQNADKIAAEAGSPEYADLCQRFRTGSKPLMKYTNMLTFNCRAIVLCLTLLAGMPWLYFVVELTVGNALFCYMWLKHERLCVETCDWIVKECQGQNK